MKIGIDRIGFATTNKYLDLDELANARGVDPNKFKIGIGQNKMAVADMTEDIVTLAINSTLEYLDDVDLAKLGLLIVGTESGIDQSKSASLFVKEALNLPNEIRTFEVKEACFGATAGLMMARDYVRAHPNHTAIVIGSDIARYGLNTSGEVTQGAGAVSMFIAQEPKIIAFEEGHASYSEDINDFWRPNNFKTALVDGKYSTEIYLKFFQKTFDAYLNQNKLTADDFTAITYHLPFTKMGLKANRLAVAEASEDSKARLEENFEYSTKYGREVGNLYTGSLYLSFLSLLENAGANLQAGKRIGFFSYGSGAMGEFFAGELVSGYEQYLNKELHQQMLSERTKLSVAEYENVFTETLKDLPEDIELSSDVTAGKYYFAGQNGFARNYKIKK
ncbi:hydroxymethylglutaryl-CoA synthase [Amylolactobacillus amylotrophicus DSM 20534]|uniref:Hydroxymethylglutaryl-CoA synthase n=3 Tax=Amylolactobacillus TaxID=2767876 RepID=A0A1L6XD52_9LACO|nr:MULTISPECIES: hydroxymethylglutaryl-CoA synthase [Amylolactobacillus]APT18891.1 hydroxymethylglutaryl-CoA synthase [Amylolactobacillus amylophilus DSM 20533 = JCM 1125]KRK38853.1 hydroxymethylglutaryl-CoA synthase [Amylolactobacillus amylotrophicus DSM 20534]KRM42504.1 hydroxymethylglutaryl-CoA synthase [Amylolactobacillus amylophilus DSM 20533 = JCM 1125]GED80076.1 hydroxymethylglutaryl-CoA synthase [Amylolactobacillus amylophilus]